MKWLALIVLASTSVLGGCNESSEVAGVKDAVVAQRVTPGISASPAVQDADEQDSKQFVAQLNGDQPVPPTGSSATGIARFHLMRDGTLRWSLRTTGLDSVFAAHIHAGAVGLNGPVVVPFYGGDPVSDLNVRGVITDPTQVAVVLELIQGGNAYVNVHTNAFQSGEIRGQVVPK